MSQLYLHCYKYRSGIKSEFDKAWAVAKGLSPDNRIIRLVASERWCSSTHRGRKQV